MSLTYQPLYKRFLEQENFEDSLRVLRTMSIYDVKEAIKLIDLNSLPVSVRAMLDMYVYQMSIADTGQRVADLVNSALSDRMFELIKESLNKPIILRGRE